MRSVENAECRKCRVLKKVNFAFQFHFIDECEKRGVCNMESNFNSLILLYSH